MRAALYALGLSGLTLVGFAGLACKDDAPASPEPAAAPATGEAEASALPRVASAVIPTDEVLWALGPEVRARTLAVSNLADDPRYSMVAETWPETTPRLGLNPEEVLALAPDVLFVASFSTPEYRAAVEDSLNLVVLEDFSGFAGYRENLDRIGDAVGAREGTDALKAEFDARVAALAAKATPEDQRPSCVSWSEGYLAGANTTFADVAALAGCRPIAAEHGVVGHQPIDTEQLLAWDPDYMVVGCVERCDETAAELAGRDGISALRAVREGHVIVIPSAEIGAVGAGMLDFAERLQTGLQGAAK